MPALRVLPEGGVIAQVTAVLAVLLIVAENCTWVPMVTVAGLGVTTTVGAAYVAVTAVAAVMFTVQVTVLADVHPDHFEKLLPPEVLGAVRVTAVPEL